MKIRTLAPVLLITLAVSLNGNWIVYGNGSLRSAAILSSANTFGITTGISPDAFAKAIGIPSSDIVYSSFGNSDIRAFDIGTTPLGVFFPLERSSFGTISTGLASSASLPNNEPNRSFVLDGSNNSSGNDLASLNVQLRVPPKTNCLSVNFAFYSEEFPEYIGSQYNDTFTLKVNGKNVAVDWLGNPVSVNTVFGIRTDTATTYDGRTDLLVAEAPVTAGAKADLIFSIEDRSDSLYDSAVFLDKFIWTDNPHCGQHTDLALSPTNSYYVRESWSDGEMLNGEQVTQAYRIGYTAPQSSSDIIILHFGRQLRDPNDSSKWQVRLLFYPIAVFRPLDWVAKVAQDFIDGYNDGHSHLMYIAIGVNNANEPWSCQNTTQDQSGDIDPEWYEAGKEWGRLVTSLTTRSIVSIKSANDIEAWRFTEKDPKNPNKEIVVWKACSQGAINWWKGFVDGTGKPAGDVHNVNFGDHAHSQDASQWPVSDVYSLSYRLPGTEFYPQIYCESQPKAYLRLYDEGYIFFPGVTSSNGSPSPNSKKHCTNGPDSEKTFTWRESWDKFNDALSPRHPEALGKSVTIPIQYPTGTLSTFDSTLSTLETTIVPIQR